MPLSPDQIATLQKQLRAERRRILGNITALRDEFGDSITDDTEENGLETHMGDQGTATFLRERDLTLEEHEQSLIDEIEAALQRINDGTYGICENTGDEISFERLQALPWARFCLEHAPT